MTRGRELAGESAPPRGMHRRTDTIHHSQSPRTHSISAAAVPSTTVLIPPTTAILYHYYQLLPTTALPTISNQYPKPKRSGITMSSPSRLVAIAIVVVVGASSWCHAFVAPSSSCHAFAAPLISSQVISPSSSSSSSSASSSTAITFFDSSSRSRTTLFNKRRGQLGNNVSFDDDGTVRLISNKQKQRRGSNISSANKKSSNKRGSKGGVDGENEVLISPLLAQWAATGMVDSPSISSSVAAFNSITDDDDDDDAAAAVNYQVLDGTTSSQKVDILLEEINAMLSTNNCNVPNLVANIVSLVNLGSQSSSSKNNDRICSPH